MRVVSIWHTGMRSTLEYWALPGNWYIHVNPWDHAAGAEAYLRKYQADGFIMPLRDPLEVWKSWERRSLRKHGRTNYGENTKAYFEYVWQAAMALVDAYGVMLQPVDHERRKDYVEAISKAYKVCPVLAEFPHIKDDMPEAEHDPSGIDFDAIYYRLEERDVIYPRKHRPTLIA